MSDSLKILTEELNKKTEELEEIASKIDSLLKNYPLLTVVKDDIIPYSLEEIELILSSSNSRQARWWLFFLFTAVRSGEMRQLRWRDIDFENQQ